MTGHKNAHAQPKSLLDLCVSELTCTLSLSKYLRQKHLGNKTEMQSDKWKNNGFTSGKTRIPFFLHKWERRVTAFGALNIAQICHISIVGETDVYAFVNI